MYCIKGKSRLTNLINFYDEMTGIVDERRAIGVVCFFSVGSLTLSPVRHS